MVDRPCRERLFVALILCIALRATAASAAEVTLIAPGGFRTPAMRLIPMFERATGDKVKAVFGSGGRSKDQVIKGGDFDVSIFEPPVDTLLASHQVIAASQTPLASVSVGIAVAAGATKPDISTPAAVKSLLLHARAIAYPNGATGAGAGLSFNETLRRLGIFDQMRPKIKIASGGAGAMQLVAKGDVDIGLTYISEMIHEPGVEVVGPLPTDISTPTPFIAFLSSHAEQPAAAKALIVFLSSREAAAVYRQSGLDPTRSETR